MRGNKGFSMGGDPASPPDVRRRRMAAPGWGLFEQIWTARYTCLRPGWGSFLQDSRKRAVADRVGVGKDTVAQTRPVRYDASASRHITRVLAGLSRGLVPARGQ